MTWERYCLGLPGITILIADNQLDNAEATRSLGVDAYLGKLEEVREEDIRIAILNEMDQYDKWSARSQAAQMLIDGKGVGRVVNELYSVSGMPEQASS
ncbi:hypothetical protein D3C78_1681000 [compost metagenome]